MSGRPLIPATSALADLVGRRLPGGCDDCIAYQTINQLGVDYFELVVHHDVTCPWLGASDDTS
jgi:hypothetical protein